MELDLDRAVLLAADRIGPEEIDVGVDVGAIERAAVVGGDDAKQVGLRLQRRVEAPAGGEIEEERRGAVGGDGCLREEIVGDGVDVIEPDPPADERLRIGAAAEELGDHADESWLHQRSPRVIRRELYGRQLPVVKPTVVGRSGKAAIAARIFDRGDDGISVTVPEGFSVQATRSSGPDPLPRQDAIDLMESWWRYPALETTLRLLDRVFSARARWRISPWGAAIIEAARELGCRELLFEDFSAGQDFDGIRMVNPFA